MIKAVQQNLFVEDSVQGPVLVDVKCFLVPQIFDVDGFARVKAKPLSELFHLIIEKVDLLLTAIDALRILLDFPDTCSSQQGSVSHCHNDSLTHALTPRKPAPIQQLVALTQTRDDWHYKFSMLISHLRTNITGTTNTLCLCVTTFSCNFKLLRTIHLVMTLHTANVKQQPRVHSWLFLLLTSLENIITQINACMCYRTCRRFLPTSEC